MKESFVSGEDGSTCLAGPNGAFEYFKILSWFCFIDMVGLCEMSISLMVQDLSVAVIERASKVFIVLPNMLFQLVLARESFHAAITFLNSAKEVASC